MNTTTEPQTDVRVTGLGDRGYIIVVSCEDRPTIGLAVRDEHGVEASQILTRDEAADVVANLTAALGQ
jgi:hypothetical protein